MRKWSRTRKFFRRSVATLLGFLAPQNLRYELRSAFVKFRQSRKSSRRWTKWRTAVRELRQQLWRFRLDWNMATLNSAMLHSLRRSWRLCKNRQRRIWKRCVNCSQYSMISLRQPENVVRKIILNEISCSGISSIRLIGYAAPRNHNRRQLGSPSKLQKNIEMFSSRACSKRNFGLLERNHDGKRGRIRSLRK